MISTGVQNVTIILGIFLAGTDTLYLKIIAVVILGNHFFYFF